MTTIINNLLAIPGVGLSLLGFGGLALLLGGMQLAHAWGFSGAGARRPAPKLLLPPQSMDEENVA